VQRQVGAEANTVVSLYRRLFPSASDGDLLVRIQTDSGFWTSAIALAERQTQQARAPVYMFRFDWKTPSFAGRFGAVHGSEIAFVLDNTRHMPVLTHDLPQAHALAARMNAAWIAFARNGKPRVSELPDWPAYTPTTRATMLFDDMCRVENDPDGEARRYWAQARART